MILDFKRWAIFGAALPALAFLALVIWIIPFIWGQAAANNSQNMLGRLFFGYLILFSLAAAIRQHRLNKKQPEARQPKLSPHFRLALSACLLVCGSIMSFSLCSDAWFLAGMFSGPGTVFGISGIVEEKNRPIGWRILADLVAILNGAIFAMNVYPELGRLRAYF